MKSMLCWLAASLLLVVTGAVAASKGAQPSLAEIRTQQTSLLTEVVEGSGRFKDMAPADRDELAKRQQALLKLIDGKSSVAELGEVDKTTAFNELEWIKATITGVEDQRMICERRRPPGSNRIERVCMTVAERRLAQEAGAKDMQGRSNCFDGNRACRDNQEGAYTW